jgi:hypothetical protein
MTIPTTGGPQEITMPVTFTFAGCGYTTSKDFPGAFSFAPIMGNYVTRPAAEVYIVRYGTLKT